MNNNTQIKVNKIRAEYMEKSLELFQNYIIIAEKNNEPELAKALKKEYKKINKWMLGIQPIYLITNIGTKIKCLIRTALSRI